MRYDIQKINFVTDLGKINVSLDTFVVDIQCEIKSDLELYGVYKNTITFPNYFGDNWDAFWDVMADLSWVPQKNIIIRHFKLPSLTDHELKNYLEILIDTIDHWEKFEEHKVQVYFSVKDKGKIEETLHN